MRLRTLYLLFFILSAFVLKAQDEYDWKLVKKTGGITAYVKKNPDTKVRSVKVETITTVSLSEAICIIKDAENHHNWVFVNSEAYVLDTIDDYNWVYYGKSDLPWPVSDRDLVAKANIEQDSLDYSVTITSVGDPGYLPVNDGCVRIMDVESKWVLNPLGNGTVHLTFELTIDVGGTIPLWFVNLAVAKGPVQTMEGLLKVIDSGSYRGRKVDLIEEF